MLTWLLDCCAGLLVHCSASRAHLMMCAHTICSSIIDTGILLLLCAAAAALLLCRLGYAAAAAAAAARLLF
jgi:hypothetical protein